MLERQAAFLDAAATASPDPAQRDSLHFTATWYRSLKDQHNCPAP